jgi:hypothetical protein
MQIALAIMDEVEDLEAGKIQVPKITTIGEDFLAESVGSNWFVQVNGKRFRKTNVVIKSKIASFLPQTRYAS